MPRPAIIAIVLLSLVGGAVGAWLSLPPSAANGSSAPFAGSWDPADPLLGEKAYVMCQGCHGADGRGVPGYAPALAASRWLTGSPEAAALIVLHGFDSTSEPGSAYVSSRMLGHGRQLTDAEIAALLTHARASWGNQAPAVAAGAVSAARARFSSRSAPWSPAELRAITR